MKQLRKKEIKSFLKASYKPGKKIPDNIYDHHLSGKRVSVYHNPTTGKATVIHRGTASLTDWVKTNIPMALGYEGGKRFKHAKKIQKKAEKKYGASNVTTMGHSLGGRIAEKVGKKSSQIITYNKAATPKSIQKATPKNQIDIRTTGDLVSKLSTVQRHKTKMKTINSGLLNPIAAHDISLIK
jgi:hypothetical protein